jgi:hypothetical protein
MDGFTIHVSAWTATFMAKVPIWMTFWYVMYGFHAFIAPRDKKDFALLRVIVFWSVFTLAQITLSEWSVLLIPWPKA